MQLGLLPEKSSVLSSSSKAGTEVDEITSGVRALQTRAATTGKERSPTGDSAMSERLDCPTTMIVVVASTAGP